MTEELNFVTEFTVLDVTIDGKKYALKEASGTVAAEYKDAISQDMVFEKNGSTRLSVATRQLEIKLLSRCLKDEQGFPVDAKTLHSWPYRVTKPLVEKLKEISDLNEEDEDEKETLEGNGSEGNEDGCDLQDTSDTPSMK